LEGQSRLNFYKHHLGDYDGATAHLTWDEDAAYTRLLRAYYRRERPIPDAEKHRLTRASSKVQRAAVDTVLAEFFELRDDGWHNKRADEEIAAYQAQADTNRRIARSRSGQRSGLDSLNEPSNDSSTKGTPNHKPEPRTISQSKSKACAVAPDWLPAEWFEFEQHRKEKGSSLTPTARRNCIAKLERWKTEGKDIASIIRHSIEQGYTGIFEPTPQRGNVHGVTAHNVSSAQQWLMQERAHEKPTT
jgi:uncharacterized protein YdaU (DUF1376 family)